MSETIPFLSVHRPVQNISQEQIGVLASRLFQETNGSEISRQTVDELFIPSDRLSAPIITHGEFLRIQNQLGANRLDDEEVAALENRLEETFSGYPKTREAGTRPVDIRRKANSPNFFLAIADSIETVRERQLAQALIMSAIGKEDLPRGWFGHTRKTTPVALAVSRTSLGLRLLNRLEGMVEEDRGVPRQTVLGKLQINRSDKHLIK